MELYPTLVDDVLWIRFNQNFEDKTIRIRSVTGSILIEAKTSDNILDIRSLSLISGIYFVECHMGGQMICSKFIKR